MNELQIALGIAVMFLVRIGLPVLVLVMIGTAIDRWQTQRANEAR